MVFRQKIILALFIILGTITQIAPVFKSGLTYPFGIGFWGPSGHDSVWHLSLINHIDNPYIINMPIFSGEILKNYHPFFDIFIAYLSKLSHISSSIWLFQLWPIFSSITLLYLSFYYGRLITKHYYGGILLLSINSLANSFGCLVSLFKYGNLSGESMFWSMQSPSNQINQPYTLSIIFILILLILLHANILSIKKLFFIFVVLSLLPIIKAYSAVVGFGVFGLYLLRRPQLRNILTFSASLAVAILIFLHFNPTSSGLLIFQPFWFLNSMIDSPDKLYIPKLSSFKNTLESLSYFDFRLIIVYLTTFIIFIVGNFSYRLIGIIYFIKKRTFNDYGLLSIICLLIIIPTLFIQKGTSWNTIQFLYYALFLSNIYLAKYLYSIINTKKGILLTLIIFTSYVSGFFGMLSNYTGKIPPAAIPAGEKLALAYLSNQSPGVVLTVPYDKYLKDNFKATPIPLYAYETTAYVSAYGQQVTYFEDEMNLSNSEYNVFDRRNRALTFFRQLNIYQDRGFLVNNQIDYIYIAGIQKNNIKLDTQNLYLTQIYENNDALIYRVQR